MNLPDGRLTAARDSGGSTTGEALFAGIMRSMQYYRATWLEQLTLRGTGWMSRLATLWLCRRVGRKADERAFYMAARIVYAPPDDRARDRVLRLFGEWRDRDFRMRVLYGLREASDTGRQECHRLAPDLPHTVTDFLLTDDRITRYLDEEEPPLPRPSGAGHQDIAQWLVDAALHSTDERSRRDLAGLLAETSQPDLVEHLDVVFWEAFDNEKRRAVSKVRLWDDGHPTTLTRIVTANPNVPRPLTERERTAAGVPVSAPQAVLAVMKNRLDRISDYLVPRFAQATVRELLAVLDLPAPQEVKDRCRQVLRDLPPGIAREELVRTAIHDHDEAIAAAADAGYLPKEKRDALAFLFITRQWERYDEADPDGSKLTAYCAEHAYYYVDTYRHQIEHAAHISGRPNPCPELPEPDLSEPTSRQSRSFGGWPTSPDSGFGSW